MLSKIRMPKSERSPKLKSETLKQAKTFLTTDGHRWARIFNCKERKERKGGGARLLTSRFNSQLSTLNPQPASRHLSLATCHLSAQNRPMPRHVRPKAFYVDADKVYGKMGNQVSTLRALLSAFRLWPLLFPPSTVSIFALCEPISPKY